MCAERMRQITPGTLHGLLSLIPECLVLVQEMRTLKTGENSFSKFMESVFAYGAEM